MNGALRAEWLRLRRRPDVWFAVAAVVGLTAFAFFSSYLASIDHGVTGVDLDTLPPEVAAEAAAFRAPYALPQSVLTILAGSWPLGLAGAYLAFSTIGGEFSFGTIRPSLTTGLSRRTFLGARLIALGAIVVAMCGVVLVLGIALPIVLAVVGQDLPAVPAPSLGGLLGEAAARCLAAIVYVALGSLVAVLTRSITTATVMTLTILLVEAVVSSSVRSGPLRWIADYSPTDAANAVIDNAHRIAGAVPPVDDFARIALASPPAVPPLASLVVALGWLAGLLAAAFLVFERADITD